MTDLTVFICIWVVSSIISLVGIFHELAEDGKVGPEDRFMILLSISPLSPIVAFVCIVVNGVVWCIRFKRRHTWRGPLVRLAEYLHKKRQEKKREKKIPEA